MLEAKIPAEIQEYKSKIIAGLSLRQLIAIGGAIAVGVPVGVFGYGKISNDLLLWLVILIVVPFAGYGFLHFKGMVFEEFVKVMFRYYFLPQKRVYEDTDANLFIGLNEELLELEIEQQRLEYEDDETEWR
ncbi:MAG: PrgI family protein [Oscillospiraceae bacterium]|nr:PrgI family protein [Oscillospiraceae bacterium]